MFKLESNDQFSQMSVYEQNELLNFLNSYFIEYRDKINLNDNMTFGVEIECLIPEMRLYNTKHKKYTDFNLAEDISIDHCGWEFQSPILKDDLNCWQDLKNTCDYLKQTCLINDYCGGHIHFGAHVFGDNSEYLLNFIYLWMAYEDIIYRFGNGEFLNSRKIINEYAGPITYKYQEIFSNGYPSSTKDILTALKLSEQNLGLNFFHYYLYFNNLTTKKNTIEFRAPNGTLEEVIWQNNINFFGKLIEAALNTDLDIEKMNYYIDMVKTDDLINEYSKVNFSKALELADMIFEKNIDKLNFLRQYIKDGKECQSKSLVRSKKFWTTK